MYKLTETDKILRLSDNVLISWEDRENEDLVAYLKWMDGYEKIDGEWVKVCDENNPEPADIPPQPDYATAKRIAYQLESDPLFFKYQRGEIEKQVWLDKVEEIKNRYTQNQPQ